MEPSGRSPTLLGKIANTLPINAKVSVSKIASRKFEVVIGTQPQPIIEEYDLQQSGMLLHIKPQNDKYFCCTIHLVPGGSNLSVASARFPIGDTLPESTGVWGGGGT